MKKVFCLLLTVGALNLKAQVMDTTKHSGKIIDYNTTIIFPTDDATGGTTQGRPCENSLINSGPCCHYYQVTCGGKVVWKSPTMCDDWCLYGMGSLFFGEQRVINPPTKDKPKKLKIDFGFNIINTEIPLSIQEIYGLKDEFKNVYFEIQEDLILKNEKTLMIYKKGIYLIKNGKLEVNYYYANTN